MAGIKIDPEMLDIYMELLNKLMAGSETDGGNARLEVSGAGKTEDGLVRYNEEVNKLGDDLRELYGNEGEILGRIRDGTLFKNADKVSVVARSTDDAGVLAKHADEAAAWLHGGKVFRYSDETAGAVASGEKLLKESQTVYESFADMMSPDDAAKYLDFLENGSKEGLTGAELAGVEKADALLVSRKVEYEDVWDLRNAGDLLESGTSSLIDIDAIRPKLKTQPDTAFFWSGRTDGIGGAENAANIAKSRGGVTLESTIEIQNIVMPEWDFNNPSTMEAWDLASGAYAEQVSGEIRAVIGSELRPGNIWENVELPRLKNNPNVTKITTIDPKTGVENVV